MASPGQKKGSCGHIMALFDAHSLNVHVAMRRALPKTLV